MRPKAFFINGGAGRVLCSVPAFEKYQEEISEDFIIVCESGAEFFKGHFSLQDKIYDPWHKNLFEDKIKHRDCVSLEPYRVWEYYNQECNLSQAFDIEINNKGVRELPKPTLRLTREELMSGSSAVKEVKQKTKKDKLIFIQPFGRGAQHIGNYINDSSGRSFEYQNLVNIIKKLEKDYAIIVMSEWQIDFEKEGCKNPVAQPQNVDLRHWAGIIKSSDYFLGCDSVGQHIAYAFDIPTTVVAGATFPENISYPNSPNFDIQDMGEGLRKYDPIRIVPDEYVNKNNDGIMLMNEAIENVIVESIHKNTSKTPQKNNTLIDNKKQDKKLLQKEESK
jgi:hypothetical protein